MADSFDARTVRREFSAVPIRGGAVAFRASSDSLKVAMMPPLFLAVSIAAIATAVVAAGCSRNVSDDDVMRVTLTGDGCRYQGDTTPTPGLFTIEVRNESSEPAHFELIELPAGTTLEDVESWFEEARQRYEQTGTYSVRHRITWVSVTLVGSHATSELPGNASTGRFAVLCHASNGPPGRPLRSVPSPVIAAAELDVTPNE